MRKKLRIGYVGWIGKHNLGDDACFFATSYLLKRYLKVDYKLIVKKYALILRPNSWVERHPGLVNYDFLICGGGTLLSPWALPWDRFFRLAGKKGVPYVIFGTGVRNPHFYKPAGCKLTKETKNLLKSVIEKARFVGVRGEESKQTLLEVGCDEKKIEVIGDPALVYYKQINKNPNKKKEKKERIIGINIGGISINTRYGEIYGRDEGIVIKTITKLTRYLLSKNFKVIFIPLWIGDLLAQWSVVNIFGENQNIVSINKLLGLSSLIKVISKCDFLIGERLHSIVFAASASVPFLSFAYRPKCIDFARSVDCGEYVVKTNEKDPAKRLIKKFNKAWKEKEKIKKRIERNVKEYQSRLENFAKRTAKAIEDETKEVQE